MRTLALLALLAAAPAHAADWTIDPARSHLTFTGTQAGQPFTGAFKTFSGTIAFDPAHPEAAHAAIVIAMASAATGDPQKDQALPQADWFAADAFPKATLDLAGFQPKGDNAYEAPGKLTIRSVAKDVPVPFTLALTGPEAHAKGHVVLHRADYGVGQGRWADGKWVALDVAVDFDIVATTKGE